MRDEQGRTFHLSDDLERPAGAALSAGWLGAIGLMGAAGLLAIFGAPFHRDKRPSVPVPPQRLKPQDGSCAGGGD